MLVTALVLAVLAFVLAAAALVIASCVAAGYARERERADSRVRPREYSVGDPYP